MSPDDLTDDLRTIAVAEDPSNDEDQEALSYSDPGTIVFTIHRIRPDGPFSLTGPRYEIEIEDSWGDCAILLEEKENLEKWLSRNVRLELTGSYVMEGLTGTFSPGEPGFSDDDVAFSFDIIRRANEADLKDPLPTVPSSWPPTPAIAGIASDGALLKHAMTRPGADQLPDNAYGADPLTLKADSARLLHISPSTNEIHAGPSYRDAGSVLVEIYHVYADTLPTRRHDRYEMDILDYRGGCAELIAEGEGFEYWIDGHIDVELPGFYVIEGITGIYFKGEWGFTDDSVDYDFVSVRRATDQEIATALINWTAPQTPSFREGLGAPL